MAVQRSLASTSGSNINFRGTSPPHQCQCYIWLDDGWFVSKLALCLSIYAPPSHKLFIRGSSWRMKWLPFLVFCFHFFHSFVYSFLHRYEWEWLEDPLLIIVSFGIHSQDHRDPGTITLPWWKLWC